MNISEVKTAFKIADVEYVEGSTKLNFKYLENLVDENGKPLPKDILTKNYSSVFLIVVNSEIKYIGISENKLGIKGTLNNYQDGGENGIPNLNKAGIWYFIYHSVLQKSNVEFYMVYHENFQAEVKGLFGLHKLLEVNINCKFIEECCVADYISKEGKHPAWNIQEQGADWSDEIKAEHSNITQKSLERKTSRKKIDL